VLATYGSVGALSALATLVTPYGLQLYSHIWNFFGDHALLDIVDEFQSPNFHSASGKLIEVLLLLSAVAGAQALRSRRFVDFGLVLLWAHLSLQAERHVALAAMVLTPIVAEHFTVLFGDIGNAVGRSANFVRWRRAAQDWHRGMLAIDRQVHGRALYILSAVFLLLLISSPRAEKLLSPHFDASRFPVAAADFIAASHLKGNPYAHDQFGGYMIYRLWPQVSVFIDGRGDFYHQSAVVDDAIHIVTVKPDWQTLLDKYDVGWMLLRRNEPLALIAALNGKWENVYSDATAQVFVRKSIHMIGR
jgi:hypothetical protein